MKQSFLICILTLLFAHPATLFAQSVVWAQKAQASSQAFGQAITTDPQGNVIVTGTFSGSVTLGKTGNTKTLNSAGGLDVFVAKYSCSGNLLWAVSIGGSGEDRSTWDRMGAAVHTNGSIFIAGSYTGTCTFGTSSGSNITRSTGGSKHVFLACYTGNGVIKWVQNTGGTLLEQGHNVRIAPDGRVYVTGNYSGTSVPFYTAPGSSSSQSYTATAYEDVFVAQYDTSGNLQWVRAAGSSQSEGAVSLAFDAQSNVYLTGAFGYNGVSGTFGPFTLGNTGGWGAYLAKLDKNGNWIWAKSVGGSSSELGIDLVVSGNQIYWLGIFNSSTTINFPPSAPVTLTSKGGQDIFVAKLDTSGQLQHTHTIGSPGTDEGERIIMGGNGDIYISGLFQNQVKIGWGTDSLLLSSAGGYDIFLARYYSATMKPYEVFRAGGTGDDVSRGFCYDPGIQQLYGTGYFTGNSVWGSTTLSTTATSDMFLARVGKNLYPAVALTISANKTQICPGDSSVLSVTIPSAIHSYQWLFNGAAIPGAKGMSYAAKTGGSFRVVADLCGQVDTSAAYTITELMGAAHVQQGAITLCAGDSALLIASANGATQYAWTPATTAGSPTQAITWVTPSVTTTYIVNASNSSCQSKDSVKVTVTPKVTVSATNDSICAGDSVLLTAFSNGAASFAWTPAASVSNPAQAQTWATPSVTTTYSVSVQNGFCQSKDSLKITVIPKVSASASRDSICAGDSVLLTASSAGAASFSWTPAATVSQPAQAQTWATPSTTTTYSVSVQIGFCQSANSVTVTVIPNVVVSATSDSICAGDSVILTAFSPGATSFAWTPAATVNQPAQAQTWATPSATTTYSVSVKNGFCQSANSVLVTVIPNVIASATSDSICAGDSVLLTAFSPGATSFAWMPATTVNQPAQAQTWATPSATTTYSVSVLNGFCQSANSVAVTVIPNVIASATSDSICAGDSVLLTAFSPGATSFAWTPATTVSQPGQAQTYATPAADSWYTITAHNSSCMSKDSVFIAVSPLTQASFTHSINGFFCTFSNQSQNALGYLWDFGDGSNSFKADPTYTYASPGTYHISLIAFGICGNDTDTITIVIQPNGIGKIFNQNQLLVYPNPAHRQLTLKSAGSLMKVVTLYSLTGVQLLQKQIHEYDVTLSLPELAPGNYLLDVETADDSHFRQRLVIH